LSGGGPEGAIRARDRAARGRANAAERRANAAEIRSFMRVLGDLSICSESGPAPFSGHHRKPDGGLPGPVPGRAPSRYLPGVLYHPVARSRLPSRPRARGPLRPAFSEERTTESPTLPVAIPTAFCSRSASSALMFAWEPLASPTLGKVASVLAAKPLPPSRPFRRGPPAVVASHSALSTGVPSGPYRPCPIREAGSRDTRYPSANCQRVR
jgi:hypothetical protein